MKLMANEGELEISREQIPAASTILSILKRHEVYEAPTYGPPGERADQRFEREAPNELWQLDFKGEFRLGNQQWCYPLTLIDDHSRFNLSLTALKGTRREPVQQTLTTVFRRYGMPEALLADNGPPWGSLQNTREGRRVCYTRLEVWLMRLGIRVIHSRPGHPQTHGKNERFNGTLQAELLHYEDFRDLPHAQQRFDWWRNRYNTERPHQSLGEHPPASRYQPSRREFPEELPDVRYDQSDELRKVSEDGSIGYQGTTYRVGQAFGGHRVAIRGQANRPGKMIYFCQHPIKEITPEKE